LSRVKVLSIRRRGFSELSEEALKELDEAIKEAIEGKGRPLKEIIKEVKKG